MYFKQGKYPEALDCHNKSLDIKIRVVGPENLVVATTYLNMGAAWKEMGDNDKAMEYYSSALPILEKVHGPDHPHVADTQVPQI